MGKLYKLYTTLNELEKTVYLKKGDIILYRKGSEIFKVTEDYVWTYKTTGFPRDKRRRLEDSEVVADTAINRKLYPNAEKIEEYLTVEN